MSDADLSDEIADPARTDDWQSIDAARALRSGHAIGVGDTVAHRSHEFLLTVERISGPYPDLTVRCVRRSPDGATILADHLPIDELTPVAFEPSLEEVEAASGRIRAHGTPFRFRLQGGGFGVSLCELTGRGNSDGFATIDLDRRLSEAGWAEGVGPNDGMPPAEVEP